MARTTMADQLAALEAKYEDAVSQNGRLVAEKAGYQSRIDQMQTALNLLQPEQEKRVALERKVEDLEKKLKDKESSYTYANTALTQTQNELEQAHAVLDSVDGAPTREYEADYGKRQRNVVTRLAGAFLAIAQRNGKVVA